MASVEISLPRKAIALDLGLRGGFGTGYNKRSRAGVVKDLGEETAQNGSSSC